MRCKLRLSSRRLVRACKPNAWPIWAYLFVRYTVWSVQIRGTTFGQTISECLPWASAEYTLVLAIAGKNDALFSFMGSVSIRCNEMLRHLERPTKTSILLAKTDGFEKIVWRIYIDDDKFRNVTPFIAHHSQKYWGDIHEQLIPFATYNLRKRDFGRRGILIPNSRQNSIYHYPFVRL